MAANFDAKKKKSIFPQNQQEPVFSPGSMQNAKTALHAEIDRSAFRGRCKV